MMIKLLIRLTIILTTSFCANAYFMGISYAQDGGFYDGGPLEDDELSAEDEGKVNDFFGIPEEDLRGEIVLDAETEEEARIANEKYRRELEEQKKTKAQEESDRGGQDYFSGINVASDGNTVPVPKRVQTANKATGLISLYPLRLQVISKFGSSTEGPNPKLVHIAPMTAWVRVERGSVLQLDIGYVRPGNATPSRKILLWSKLKSPHHKLPNETLYELGIYPDDGDELVWKQSTHSTWVTHANITKKSSFTQKTIAGDKRKHEGYVQIQTAILKPGDYQFWVKLYHKENGKTVETDTQRFNFKVVDAPLHIESNIPTSLATYNPDRNVWAGEYSAQISDWAVPPIKGEITSNVTGFSLPYGGSIEETMFDFNLRPRKKFIGSKQSFTLEVTDGLGRTATLRRSVNITDSSSSEIKVNMARFVNAGSSISGTVIYPAGFALSKKPRIGDTRGFKWTNSDYTSFRINVNEEGVHHKRLFAIVVSGKMDGASEEQVLTWKRVYKVKSQNLIYDEERNRRRHDANNKIFSDALGAIASGVGAAASAYGDVNASSGSGNSYSSSDDDYDDGDEGFQAIAPPANGSPNYDGINIDTGQIKPLSTITPRQPNTQASGNSYSTNRALNNPDNFPIGSENSEEITETNICGVAILGRRGHYDKNGDIMFESNRGWIRDRDDNSDFEVNNRDYDVVLLTKLGIPYDGHLQIHELAFYKHNCAQAYETIPTSTGASSMYEFHTNGGKKLVDTEHVDTSKNVYKEWDRAGNLINQVGVNGDTICSNNPSHEAPKKCS